MSLNETMNNLVEFKGSKDGLIVNVKKDASYYDIKSAIIGKLESAIGFFNGAKIIAINCEYLTDIQILQIKDELSSKFDVEFIENNIYKQKKEIINTKYINNLRSGGNVEYNGDIVVMTDVKSGSQITSSSNVVVMGNVESGAKVVANGNIIVMGSVKGFIYAGANGNENAYVVAQVFKPKVVQISSYIAEAPEDDYEDEKESYPEVAFVSDGMIVVENYLPKKKLGGHINE